MEIQDTIQKIRDGVCKIEFIQNSQVVNSGSGFLYSNKMVTNSHVFHPDGYIFPSDTKINLIFGDNYEKELLLSDFILISGSDENNSDYSIFEIKELETEVNQRYNFELAALDEVREGDDVMVLGFPFETKYLTTHYGKISALFTENRIKKIQIDASVNQGNSGGPLWHFKTGKVIGIITRKQTGLTKDFDDLIQSFAENIEILKRSQGNGYVTLSGVNPIQSLEATQFQMLKLSVNLRRSANTGIGYAFSCEELLRFL